MNFIRIISVEVMLFLRALLALLSNFKMEKSIVLKQSKTLASGNYDSGRDTSGINPPKPKKNRCDIQSTSHRTRCIKKKKNRVSKFKDHLYTDYYFSR